MKVWFTRDESGQRGNGENATQVKFGRFMGIYI